MSEGTSPHTWSSLDSQSRAIIYIRVSTKKQLKSLETQKKICIDYCRKNNFKVVSIIEDICSGTIKISLRRGGKKLIELLERGEATHLVVASLDRLARYENWIHEFTKYNVIIHLVIEKKVIIPKLEIEEKEKQPLKKLGLCEKCLNLMLRKTIRYITEFVEPSNYNCDLKELYFALKSVLATIYYFIPDLYVKYIEVLHNSGIPQECLTYFEKLQLDEFRKCITTKINKKERETIRERIIRIVMSGS